MPTNERRARLVEWIMAGVRKADGTVNALGSVGALEPGTSTPRAIWQTRDKQAGSTWPGGVVTLDANGRPAGLLPGQGVFADGLYKLEVRNASSGVEYTVDEAHYEYELINVRDFGAVGDGATDDTDALQAAIDYALRSSGSGGQSDPEKGIITRVYLPAGTYRITRALLILAPRTNIPRQGDALPSAGGQWWLPTLELYGDKRAVTNAPGIFDGNSVIFQDSLVEPAVIMQAVRMVSIRRLAIQGRNTWVETILNDGDYGKLLNDSEVTPPGGQSSRAWLGALRPVWHLRRSRSPAAHPS